MAFSLCCCQVSFARTCRYVVRSRIDHVYTSDLCPLHSFLSYFEKIAHSRTEDWTVYLCMYGLCHTNQIEATILPCKVIHQ